MRAAGFSYARMRNTKLPKMGGGAEGEWPAEESGDNS